MRLSLWRSCFLKSDKVNHIKYYNNEIYEDVKVKMDDIKETCPICLYSIDSDKMFKTNKCNHSFCSYCAYTMVESRLNHSWCSKCPMCREQLSSDDIDMIYKIKEKQEDLSHFSVDERLYMIIHKLNTINPHIGAASVLLASIKNYPIEDTMQQVSAISDYFEGRIDYAEMRRNAG